VTPEHSLVSCLPAFLKQRIRLHSPFEVSPTDAAAPVFYWMRVAVRDHENPALDVALAIAEAEQRSVLVYHALSERYPYASDRHHTFILEGARDVAAAFAARGIPYAFHLERPGAREAVLAKLAKSARAVVTELMPVEPLRGWTQTVAQLAPVLEVDASCIFPMTGGLKKAPTRAFEFRKAAAKAQSQVLEEGYPSFPFALRKDWQALAQLPFEPVSLETVSIRELVQSLSIDHSVAPVPDSPGGSIAGYARWSKYVAGDLARYGATRNDPLLDTTSRMSAYLHYGHVSPFTLAGDLYKRIKTNPGAEKFLDEMLIWRELAWHFCFHTEELDAVQSLPRWAVETLKAHESETRDSQPSWEQLAHGRTDDALWNACQRSLLAHGELHNNVRMTWGKKLLEWTSTAGEALSLLLDLNHRYALDGRDPASYAGIQWCFGAFDRPFEPASDILGTVRPRPTQIHQERLNTNAYTALVNRSPFKRKPRVAIIGSGIAGLAAARTLDSHNVEVTVFDKGRRAGGRLVSRELMGVPFDYGAQYFTAKHDDFRLLVQSLVWEEVLDVWKPRVSALFDGELCNVDAKALAVPWYTAADGFSSLAKRLAEGLDVRQSMHLASIEKQVDGVRLHFKDGAVERFDHVLVSVPGPQAAALVPETPAVLYAPCWSLTLAVSEAVTRALAFDALQIEDAPGKPSPSLAWLCCETSKPGRKEARTLGFDVWTLHASAAFSNKHLEADPTVVQQALREAFFALCGASPGTEVLDSHLHKWRFARAVNVLRTATPYAQFGSVGVGGDSFGGPRVESAYLSGVALAGDLLRTLAAEGAGARHA
jgi:photolyase PhrII